MAGMLPDLTLTPGGQFGIYIHVPFCATRCGYCDFNTYTAEELGAGESRSTYADTVISSLDPKRTFLRLMEPGDLSPDLVRKAREFKSRGSSGASASASE